MPKSSPASPPLSTATPAVKVSGPSKKPSAQQAFNQLFGARQQGEAAASGLKLVDPALIAVSEQPRTVFPAAEIQELASSIDELRSVNEGIEGTGILQPLIVTALTGTGSAGPRYRLVAGERRLRAAKQLNSERVPVLVLNVHQDAVLPIQLIENVQRAGLQPLEEGRALRKLMDEAKLSIREAARWLGKDKSYVENRLRLLNMGADVHDMLAARPDTIPHARLIDAVTDAGVRAILIRAVVEDGVGEREIRRRISGDPAGATPEVPAPDSQVSLRKDSSQPGTARAKAKQQALEDQLQPVNAFFRRAVLDLQSGEIPSRDRAVLKRAVQEWKQQISDLEQMLD